MYTNLVLSGGGIRGLAFVGCIDVIENKPEFQYLKNYIGASVGSIFALFIVCGYSSKEIIDFIELNLSNPEYTSINLKNMFSFYKNCGIDDGTCIINLVKKILRDKHFSEDITFLDIAKKTGKNLIVTGSNITKHKMDYFNLENTPNMPIYLAIRISTCIPLLFTPVLYEDNYYVDAVIYNNFPIEYFKKEPSTTCGIVIRDPVTESNESNSKKTQHPPFKNVIDFVNNIIYSVMTRVEDIQIDDDLFVPKKQLYMIEVEYTNVVRFKDFKLNIDSIILDRLYKSGKQQMHSYLNSDQ